MYIDERINKDETPKQTKKKSCWVWAGGLCAVTDFSRASSTSEIFRCTIIFFCEVRFSCFLPITLNFLIIKYVLIACFLLKCEKISISSVYSPITTIYFLVRSTLTTNHCTSQPECTARPDR